MLAHLYGDMGAALAAGDLWAARVAHETLGKLLAAAATRMPSPAADLAPERERHQDGQ